MRILTAIIMLSGLLIVSPEVLWASEQAAGDTLHGGTAIGQLDGHSAIHQDESHDVHHSPHLDGS